jgi:hypothetical protein
MNRQMLMLGNNGMILPDTTPPPTVAPSTIPSNNSVVPINPVIPMPVPPKKTIETLPLQPNRQTPVLAGPNGLLISMGIVPGVSTITTGGVVAAAGVSTPVGMMTPSGVRLPNGVVNNAAVIKACAMHPGCSAARPCGLTPGCGMMVPTAMVSNNAVQLASALQSPGVAGGIMQAGGMAVNRYAYPNAYPTPNQPMNGLTMSGFPQAGYPPIGYAPSGYSRSNRLAAEAGLINTAGMFSEEEEEEPQAEEAEAEIKSSMPLPRFHPVPTKPVFQRSEGLPVTPRTGKTTASGNTAAKTTSMNSKNSKVKANVNDSKRLFSDEALNEAMEQAYLEGMAAAMEEVEEELDMRSEDLAAQSEELVALSSEELVGQSEESEKTKMQEKILEQAQKLQMKIEKQKELELQIHRNALHQEARRIAVQTAEEQAAREAVREREIREESEREMAVREQAIRNEAAKEIAIHKQMIRDEAVRERAVQEQAMQSQLAQQNQLLESARIQQALMTQSQTPTPQTVQPVNYNYNRNPATGGREMIASAFEFLKGNGQRMNPQMMNQPPMSQSPMNQQTNPQPVLNRIRSPNNISMGNINAGQSATPPNIIIPQPQQYAGAGVMGGAGAGYAVPATRSIPQTMLFNGMPNNNGMANNNGMPNNNGMANTPSISGFGLFQSAKSTGTNLLSAMSGVISPFSGLLGSDTPNGRNQMFSVPRSIPVVQQVPPSRSVPAVQQFPPVQQVPSSRSVPVGQQTVHNTPHTPPTNLSPQKVNVSRMSATPSNKIPIPQLTDNSLLYSRPDDEELFPEHDLSVVHTKSATMNKRVPLSVSSKTTTEESDLSVPGLPQKPPTKSKTMTKPKRMIEVDDEEETSMIRQANFVDR